MKTTVCKSLEDFVRLAVLDTRRWVLKDFSSWEYEDKEAGIEYWKTRNGLETIRLAKTSSPDQVAEAEEKLNNLQDPTRVLVYKYWLEESKSGYYRNDRIELTQELFELLDGVWTKKERDWWKGHFDRVGRMSLKGLLKRLDQEISQEDIKKAQQEAERLMEVSKRNIARKYIRNQADKMLELVEKFDGNLPVHKSFVKDLKALVAMENES